MIFRIFWVIISMQFAGFVYYSVQCNLHMNYRPFALSGHVTLSFYENESYI